MVNLKNNILLIQNYIEKNNFSGWDPYDAMNSPLLRILSLKSKYGKIGWTQFMRRFPINLRLFLMVPRQQNPKGLGLFLGGYAKLYAADKNASYLTRIHNLLNLLQETRSSGYAGNCWGYNFDWQSRAAFVPKYTPTIVNSSFIGHALVDVYETTGIQEALDTAASIKDFILQNLNRKTEGETLCFSYTPLDNNYVHNANMLGASLLIRLSKITGDSSLREPALASLAYSMKYQHRDGGWFYAEESIQHWIDSFHTGFNLESLRWFLKLQEANEYQANYNNAVEYYADKFFLDDGTPKYYCNKERPIDIHAATEAICFFSGEGDRYRDLTEKIYHWMMNNMWNNKGGYFYFRKHSLFTVKIPYMRWSEAWGWRALTEYYYNTKTQHIE